MKWASTTTNFAQPGALTSPWWNLMTCKDVQMRLRIWTSHTWGGKLQLYVRYLCVLYIPYMLEIMIYIYILTTDHPPIDCFPPSHFTDNCGTEVPWHQGRWSLHGALAILTHQNSVGDFSRPTEATIPEKMEKAKKIAPIQSIPWTGASIRHCEFPKMVAFESWAHKSLKNPSLIYAYICFVSRHSLFNSKPKLPWICRYLTCQSFLFKRD